MKKTGFRITFEDGETLTRYLTPIMLKDIVMFVPGTTDPGNTEKLKHSAGWKYWRDAENYDNFRKQIKELKPEFLDLHIEDEFFSWSGDNSTSERNKAAERLLDLFLRVYSKWTKKAVHLHLIGHSHGGNVINQFTELISENDKFPKKWKIKSITYLSTPFFEKQHQLNHSKLHPDFKIINVFNEYDITQRFIASFTLKNLEELKSGLDFSELKLAIKRIKLIDTSSLGALKDYFGINDTTEGPPIWRTIGQLLTEVEIILACIIKNLDIIASEVKLQEFTDFVSVFKQIKPHLTTARTTIIANQVGRDEYGRPELYDDLQLINILPLVNRILAIETNENDSYLLNLIKTVLTDGKQGLIDTIDAVSKSPKKQAGKFKIVPINITRFDTYEKTGKKLDFEEFATGIEGVLTPFNNNSVNGFLMRIISQMVNPEAINGVINGISDAQWEIDGNIDTLFKQLENRLESYNGLIELYRRNLETYLTIDFSQINKLGGLDYFAMTSHSLSHSDITSDSILYENGKTFIENLKKELRQSFSSRKNPSYKNEKK